MSSRKLNLIQSNFRQGPKHINAYFLPYSAGILWSYAQSRETIKNNWTLDNLVFKRLDIESNYKRLSDCDVIGFSNYIWNKSHNYELARKIKEYNPSALIVFGGPETPIHKKDIFERYPFIDIVVKLEGEIAFADILESPNLESARNVKGILINDNGRVLDTGAATRILELDQIPSPYTTGVFDKIILENPDILWNPTLETNRGCPYQCTFCDWGGLTYSKIKHFDLVRVFEEIEWIGSHKCEHLSVTDANFGMFLERDEMIVDKIIETQQKYGYPTKTAMSWAKNQKSQVIKLASKLYGFGFNNGLTVSVQSLDDGVLTNIKRKNLQTDRLNEVFDNCALAGVSVNTELILGLPGETLQTWRETMFKLFDINQHNTIEFFQAQLLENAEMNLVQREIYEIKTVKVYDYLSGTDDYDDVPEGLEIVTSTIDLPPDAMLACQEFSWFMATMHLNGPSQWWSRFLKKYSNISYEEFYIGLQDWMLQYSWWQEERTQVTNAYSKWMTTGELSVPDIENLRIHGWNHIHVSKVRMHAYNMYDKYHHAILEYVNKFYSHLLSKTLIEDIYQFTDLYVIRYNRISNYPKQCILRHNILDYILNIAELQEADTEHKFSFTEPNNITLEDFLTGVVYRRRRNFGKAHVKTFESSKRILVSEL